MDYGVMALEWNLKTIIFVTVIIRTSMTNSPWNKAQ